VGAASPPLMGEAPSGAQRRVALGAALRLKGKGLAPHRTPRRSPAQASVLKLCRTVQARRERDLLDQTAPKPASLTHGAEWMSRQL